MRTAIRPRELKLIPGMVERGQTVADIAVAFNISQAKAAQYIGVEEPKKKKSKAKKDKA